MAIVLKIYYLYPKLKLQFSHSLSPMNPYQYNFLNPMNPYQYNFFPTEMLNVQPVANQ